MSSAWLNYHHLFYFRAIANEGGVANASRKLRLGQPTLSTQLKQFEDAIGVPLFVRERRRLHLTEAGRVALDYANEIFKLGGELVEVLHDRSKPGRTEVQIGTLDSVPKHLVVRVIERALQSLNCRIKVTEAPAEDLFDLIKSHRLDLLVTDSAPSGSGASGFKARCIKRMPVVICGSSKFKSLAEGFPGSLEGKPIIYSSAEKIRAEIETFFASKGVTVDPVADIQDSSMVKIMATHGQGLAALPEPAIEELVAARDLYVIGRIPRVFEELWLIMGNRRVANPVAQETFKHFDL